MVPFVGSRVGNLRRGGGVMEDEDRERKRERESERESCSFLSGCGQGNACFVFYLVCCHLWFVVVCTGGFCYIH